MKILNTRKPRVAGERVALPEFELIHCPTVRIADLKRRRFNIIDMAKSAAPDMVPVTVEEIMAGGVIVHLWSADIVVLK